MCKTILLSFYFLCYNRCYRTLAGWSDIYAAFLMQGIITSHIIIIIGILVDFDVEVVSIALIILAIYIFYCYYIFRRY